MSRITMRETGMEAIMKLVEGNPGAITVCIRLIKEVGDIDPDSLFGGLGPILALDTEKIYGCRIWMLYKDVCKENLIKMIAVLRSVQLGFITPNILHHAIDNYGEGIDIDNILIKVQDRLPQFKKD